MKKTILITGSTDGIGKLAAIKLAKDGHQIYLHGRNSTKLAEVISEIKSNSENDNISGFVADFSDLSAVKKMADEIKQSLTQIDVLINNAGVYKSSVQKNKDGFDMRIVVNYLAPYLLTQELLPLLTQEEGSRLINLSSAAQAPVSMEVLLGQSVVSDSTAYAQSKLALTMWSTHLAKTFPNLNVIAVNPGSLLNTRMVKEGYGFHRSPAAKGGDILYELAISEAYENASGKYFDNDIGTFGIVHPSGKNPKAIKALIEKTEELIC